MMRRSCFIVQTVIVETVPSSKRMLVSFGGSNTNCAFFSFPAKDLDAFLDGQVVAVDNDATVQFEFETGFVEIKGTLDNTRAWLSAELNLELRRMLHELAEEMG